MYVWAETCQKVGFFFLISGWRNRGYLLVGEEWRKGSKFRENGIWVLKRDGFQRWVFKFVGFGEKPIEELERLDFEKLTLSLSYILSFSYIFYFLSLSLTLPSPCYCFSFSTSVILALLWSGHSWTFLQLNTMWWDPLLSCIILRFTPLDNSPFHIKGNLESNKWWGRVEEHRWKTIISPSISFFAQ